MPSSSYPLYRTISQTFSHRQAIPTGSWRMMLGSNGKRRNQRQAQVWRRNQPPRTQFQHFSLKLPQICHLFFPLNPRICSGAEVLHIFHHHGAPSRERAYLFNGDISDRGAEAIGFSTEVAIKGKHRQIPSLSL